MVGSLLAGADEAPGEVEFSRAAHISRYRGMGSLGAMAQYDGSSDRYFQDINSGTEKLVPEGVEGRVPCKGPLSGILHQMKEGFEQRWATPGAQRLKKCAQPRAS